jgi:prophage regulatory protein
VATTVLRLPQVIQRCGFSRSAIYKLVARNEFPRPINIGVRAVAWPEDEIEQWLTDRISASRSESELSKPGKAFVPAARKG